MQDMQLFSLGAWCFFVCKAKAAHPSIGRGGREDLHFVMGAACRNGCASKTVPKSIIICHHMADALDCFSNNGATAAAAE